MLGWICSGCACCFFFFFKQKTAYEMRISDWSSDVCSSDLHLLQQILPQRGKAAEARFLRRVGGAVGKLIMREMRETDDPHAHVVEEIGRASCRERVCQYV